MYASVCPVDDETLPNRRTMGPLLGSARYGFALIAKRAAAGGMSKGAALNLATLLHWSRIDAKGCIVR